MALVQSCDFGYAQSVRDGGDARVHGSLVPAEPVSENVVHRLGGVAPAAVERAYPLWRLIGLVLPDSAHDKAKYRPHSLGLIGVESVDETMQIWVVVVCHAHGSRVAKRRALE